MNDIENLLSKLNNIEPLSVGFKQSAIRISPKRVRSNGFIFLRPGQIAKKTWHLISGFIILVGQDGNANPVVMDIITPGSIFTDMPSFYQKMPVKYKYIAVGKVEVLEYSQKYYDHFKQFPETTILIKRLAMTDISKNYAKEEMLLLPPKEKMIRFFKDYNISGLPDKYCASLLRMGLEKYVQFKVLLLKSGEIQISAEAPAYNSKTYGMQMAYEVKSYLLENYTLPDIDDIVKIAALFNTTKKTLTRHFKNNLRVTVHQLILKLRMEKAHQLLSVHKLPVKKVCSQVGYKDVYNFSRIFKHHFGFSARDTIKKDMPNFSKIVTMACVITENFVPNLHFIQSLL